MGSGSLSIKEPGSVDTQLSEMFTISGHSFLERDYRWEFLFTQSLYLILVIDKKKNEVDLEDSISDVTKCKSFWNEKFYLKSKKFVVFFFNSINRRLRVGVIRYPVLDCI